MHRARPRHPRPRRMSPRKQKQTTAVATQLSVAVPPITSRAAAVESSTLPATCPVCTDPIHIAAFGSCNHAICHMCSLRLRALYKKHDCAMCKVFDEGGGCWVLMLPSKMRPCLTALRSMYHTV